MGFLGMGVQEIVIIAIVALIIFGPERLPELAGQAGKLLRDARRMTSDLQGEFERESGVNVRELRSQVDREIAGVKSELTGATSTLQKEVNTVKKTAQSATASTRKTGTGTTSTASSTSKSSSSSTTTTSSVSAAKSSAATKKAAPEPKPVASKVDPLADVSFLDNVGAPTQSQSTASSSNGAATNGKAVTADRADAVSRARNRRLQAGYNQPR